MGGPVAPSSEVGRFLLNLSFPANASVPTLPIGAVYDPSHDLLLGLEANLGFRASALLDEAHPGSLNVSVANIQLAGQAFSSALDTQTDTVYVAEVAGTTTPVLDVQAIDPANASAGATFSTTYAGNPGSMVFDPANGLLYISSSDPGAGTTTSFYGNLSVFDPATGLFDSNPPILPSGELPGPIALDPNGSTLYVSAFPASGAGVEMLAYRVTTNNSLVAATNLSGGSALASTKLFPGSVAYDPADATVFLATSEGNASGLGIYENMTIFNASTLAIEAREPLPLVDVRVGHESAGGSLTYDPDNRDLYLTQNPNAFETNPVVPPTIPTVVVLNGSAVASGNPLAFLNVTFPWVPLAGLYVPAFGGAEGGEMWFPSWNESAAIIDGGYNVLALPPKILSFGPSAPEVDLGGSVTYSTSEELGAGNLTYSYAGLPTGCPASPAAPLVCRPTSPGTFSTTVTVRDQLGENASASTAVTVNPALVAPATVAPQAVDVGQPVSVAAFPAGGDLRYTTTWQFGDGTGASQAVTSHTYLAAGTYPVTVVVTDGLGTSVTETFNVSVSNVPSGAAIYANRTVADVGVPVGFRGVSDNGSAPIAYSWSFGDGSPAGSGLETSHAYAAPGVYVVTLTATDAAGDTARSSIRVAVAADPAGLLRVAPSAVPAGTAETFSEAIAGGEGPFTYLWTFGDGNVSTASNPTHSYARPGTYSVSVTVTDAGGTTVRNSTTLTITPAASPAAPSGGTGLSDGEAALLAGLAAVAGAAVGAVAALLVVRRRRSAGPGPGNPPP